MTINDTSLIYGWAKSLRRTLEFLKSSIGVPKLMPAFAFSHYLSIKRQNRSYNILKAIILNVLLPEFVSKLSSPTVQGDIVTSVVFVPYQLPII